MKKILYVEDNEMNRDMLGRRLTRREYEVIFAFDGQEGLDKMKSENPDLVLMDMGLPVLRWLGSDHSSKSRSRDFKYSDYCFDCSCNGA